MPLRFKTSNTRTRTLNLETLKIQEKMQICVLLLPRSNPGFVELGQRLGKETLFSYIDRFGFGKKTGVDLNGEANGILFSLNRVGPVELATTAFGQGVSVTPIQQVTAVSAILNGGTLYKPHIVKRYLEPETGEIIKEVKPTAVKTNIISLETSKIRLRKCCI